MENENRAPKLVQLTVKVNQTTLDKWRDNLQEGMFPTAGQFMELLINQYEENYSKPVRVNKENEEKIRQLQERIDTLLLENDYLKEQLSKLESIIENGTKENETLRSRLSDSMDELSTIKTDNAIQAKMDEGIIRVPVEKLDRACLQYLADRENKKRKRTDITPEVFFMFAVKEMLIKGNKFSIPCVPDSVIKELKMEIDNGQ